MLEHKKLVGSLNDKLQNERNNAEIEKMKAMIEYVAMMTDTEIPTEEGGEVHEQI